MPKVGVRYNSIQLLPHLLLNFCNVPAWMHGNVCGVKYGTAGIVMYIHCCKALYRYVAVRYLR
jgi:hypothetical protein